jgi:hypothetical protein
MRHERPKAQESECARLRTNARLPRRLPRPDGIGTEERRDKMNGKTKRRTPMNNETGRRCRALIDDESAERFRWGWTETNSQAPGDDRVRIKMKANQRKSAQSRFIDSV